MVNHLTKAVAHIAREREAADHFLPLTMATTPFVLLLLAWVGVASGYMARGPVVARPAMRAAAVARPPVVANPALRMMAEEATAASGEAAAANEVCIEDEAIEECVLAEWPAGQLKVRLLTRPAPLHPSARLAKLPISRAHLFWAPDEFAHGVMNPFLRGVRCLSRG